MQNFKPSGSASQNYYFFTFLFFSLRLLHSFCKRSFEQKFSKPSSAIPGCQTTFELKNGIKT